MTRPTFGNAKRKRMGRGSAPPERAARRTLVAPKLASPKLASPELAPDRLGALAREAGVELSPDACERLLAYAELLMRWNRVHNLTAISSRAELLTHHLLDSLAIIPSLDRALQVRTSSSGGALRVLDAGSGGGLPGFPLAVARPDWRVLLVDAVEKKTAFLQHARTELGQANIEVRHARLETLHQSGMGARFDLVVSRAFSSLADFVTLTRALLAPGGLWAAMKGRRPDEEMRVLPEDVEIVDTITLRVPMLGEQRHLILLQRRPEAPAVDT